MIGGPIGAALVGGKPNWTGAKIGAGLVAVAIPLAIRSDIKAKQAVDTFNKGLQTSSIWDGRKLKFSIAGNGIGLALIF